MAEWLMLGRSAVKGEHPGLQLAVEPSSIRQLRSMGEAPCSFECMVYAYLDPPMYLHSGPYGKVRGGAAGRAQSNGLGTPCKAYTLLCRTAWSLWLDTLK